MIQKFFIIFFGIFIGLFTGYLIVSYTPLSPSPQKEVLSIQNKQTQSKIKKQVIGFLPYWLLSKADTNYSKYITTLSYFDLIIDADGTILKYNNPQEKEPGWYTLESGKLDEFFNTAKSNKVNLSLVVFSGDNESIDQLMDNPVIHAKNLVDEIVPIMQEYGFSDLNLDIEYTKEASDEARTRFTEFTKEVKKGLDARHAGTLTVDVTGDDFIRKKLTNIHEIANIADYILIMGYDYHFSGSGVTGPVAPLNGAGTISEYDVETAVKEALLIMPSEKIILGIPLYGYEWETINDTSRSAIIPGTGIAASNRRAEETADSCVNCNIKTETEAKESYLIYRDTETNTFHQIFYPDKNATAVKTDFANKNKLGGLALWALGYEGDTILNPLEEYIK